MHNLTHTIFDFSLDSDISSWRVTDDVVMGGVSQGNFKVDENGSGIYFGKISLENSGGFSSLRYRFNKIDVSRYSKVTLRVKGDGKEYQFRIKDKIENYYSYTYKFSSVNNWQFLEISLSEMQPVFKGKKLGIGNFSSSSIEEVAILIANKKEESFQLEIDKIYLE